MLIPERDSRGTDGQTDKDGRPTGDRLRYEDGPGGKPGKVRYRCPSCVRTHGHRITERAIPWRGFAALAAALAAYPEGNLNRAVVATTNALRDAWTAAAPRDDQGTPAGDVRRACFAAWCTGPGRRTQPADEDQL